MARVAGDRVLVADNVYLGEREEEADRLRDPTHVRNLTEEEWRSVFEQSGVRVEEVVHFEKPIEVEPWLERAGCTGDEAARVRELLAHRISDGTLVLDRIAIKGLK
jgi:hypothetical protein